MIKKSALATLVATAALAGILPATAAAQQVIIARVAPPAPLVEGTPAPRRGYVWAHGHQEWRNNQYVWVPGQWLRDRQGYHYRDVRWEERNGQWARVGGDWQRGPNGDRDGDGIRNANDRDRDGDGIRNRDDNRPNNANNRRLRGPNGDLDGDGIRNSNDRDRDGDGIRNARDRFPDNSRRS